jgi:cytochrome c
MSRRMATARTAALGAAIATLGFGGGAAFAQGNDLAAGERLFRSQCMGCHSVEPDRHRAGPSLHGLFGRRSGSVEGFDFSAAMVEAEMEWTPETLDAFLADPGAVVPGTKMVFWGLAPGARRQVIRYLEAATG